MAKVLVIPDTHVRDFWKELKEKIILGGGGGGAFTRYATEDTS